MRIASDGSALLTGRQCRRVSSFLDRLLGERQALTRHRDVVHDRCQRRRGELILQFGQNRLGFGQAHAERNNTLRQRIEAGGGVDEKVAESVEFLDASFEFLVGSTARGNDVDQHLSALIGSFRDGVVESLPDREGFGEGGLGLVECCREGCDGGISELAAGQIELLLAAGDRVVRLDEDLLRAFVERRQRECVEAGDVVGGDVLRGFDACLVLVVLALT